MSVVKSLCRPGFRRKEFPTRSLVDVVLVDPRSFFTIKGTGFLVNGLVLETPTWTLYI